jgi:surface antigen
VPVPAGLPAAAVAGPPLERAAHGADQRRFDWGYCTWWVARRRAVPWNGNAVEWFANAQAMGYATGDRPLPGAILVRRSATWSGFGHVAYVESVEGTRFTVSEMNVDYVGELTTTTYDLATKPPTGLLGFVYWRYAPEPPPAEPPAEQPRGRDRGQGNLIE